MLKILAVIGWIILAILIIIIWFILVPRTFYVEYTQSKNFVVKVRLFFLKLKVYPLNISFRKKDKPKKVAKKPTNSAKSEKKDTKETKKEKNKFKEIFEYVLNNKHIVKQVLETVKGAFKILFNGITVKGVSFIMPITSDDAHDLQKKYAAMTTSFYAVNIILQKYVKIFYKSPIFVADFANLYEDKTYFYCKIQACPSIIITLGWYLFKQYKQIMANNKSLKEN